jgi:hypothetical protein
MDHHYKYLESNTYKKLIREEKIKEIKDLNLNESLSLIDNLFIYELMWMHGKSVYQSIFSLVYFTDPNIKNELEDSVFKTYLNSTHHLMYKVYSNIFTRCNCLREEDFSMIALNNVECLNRPKIMEDLKKMETKLSSMLKDKENPDKKIITNLINRFRQRRILLKILDESVYHFNISLI